MENIQGRETFLLVAQILKRNNLHATLLAFQVGSSLSTVTYFFRKKLNRL
jgi:hypothetical protein